MTEVREVLTEALAHIQAGWTQRAYARDVHGDASASGSQRATSWCAVGALSKAGAAHNVHYAACERLVETLGISTQYPESKLVEWNDDPERTQQEVVDLFERTLKESK